MENHVIFPLFKQWFENEHWWFNCTRNDDLIITKRFEHLLDIDFIVNTNFGKEDLIGLVILWDQIPRHVFRNQVAHHIIAFYLQKAVFVTKVILQRLRVNSKNDLKDVELAFVLLPLRHSNEFSNIKQALYFAWQKLLVLPTSTIIKRFLKATYKNIILEPGENIHNVFRCGQRRLDLEDINHVLVDDFNKVRFQCDPGYADMYNYVLNFVKINNIRKVIVSISGGVDSMLLSFIMNQIALQTNKLDLVFVHINYCNKSTAMIEEEFVIRWCSYLGYPIYVRRIEEIQREKCMKHGLRDVYESYTRNTRYFTYKYVWSCWLPKLDSSVPNVFLGHNKNDCFENIITNICCQQKYDNLSGMSELCNVDGISFLRPLLSFSKEQIRLCSKFNKIPHLQDSTPSWSQRGQIRDCLVPTLTLLDKNSVSAFHKLGDTLSQFYDLLDTTILSWKKNTIRSPTRTITFLTEDILSTNQLVWKHFLKDVSKTHVSSKSLDLFIKRLQTWTSKTQTSNHLKHVLKKNVMIILEKKQNGFSIILDFSQ